MRVLITGVSGTGKSALVKELRDRGFVAFDADDEGFTSPSSDGTWAWQPERVKSLFEQYGDRLVFFAGCSDEQAAFDFDLKVLLTAPTDVILQRLQSRTSNTFGKTKAERERALSDVEWVLPLLSASADLVIDTTKTVNEVANAVTQAVITGRMRDQPKEELNAIFAREQMYNRAGSTSTQRGEREAGGKHVRQLSSATMGSKRDLARLGVELIEGLGLQVFVEDPNAHSQDAQADLSIAHMRVVAVGIRHTGSSDQTREAENEIERDRLGSPISAKRSCRLGAIEVPAP